MEEKTEFAQHVAKVAQNWPDAEKPKHYTALFVTSKKVEESSDSYDLATAKYELVVCPFNDKDKTEDDKKIILTLFSLEGKGGTCSRVFNANDTDAMVEWIEDEVGGLTYTLLGTSYNTYITLVNANFINDEIFASLTDTARAIVDSISYAMQYELPKYATAFLRTMSENKMMWVDFSHQLDFTLNTLKLIKNL